MAEGGVSNRPSQLNLGIHLQQAQHLPMRDMRHGASAEADWWEEPHRMPSLTLLDSCSYGASYAGAHIRLQRHTQCFSSLHVHLASLYSSFYKGTSKRPPLPRTLSLLWTSVGAWRVYGWQLPNTPSPPF